METAYEIVIEETDERFFCAAGENILKAMERLNRKGIPVGCRGGGCGVCKVRVRSGRYSARKMSRAHVSVEEESNGIGLACRLVPESDLAVQVLGTMRKSVLAQIARTASAND
ncbi:MAG: 2Fe-2S iron-sulfur cluster binding domain-containing protein [Gammaproteobacteria bacterium]|nr:2Fe-2S iron-sulfur cluster binding domain-containing protein [Gammaproteobacteria bacterium]